MLTGLFNRHYLKAEGEKEVQRALRYRLDLTIVMLDIDHFKQINDRHGHPAGDHVLRELGQIVRASVRDVDIPVRYGERGVRIAPAPDEDGGRPVAGGTIEDSC